jgi:hypothetical protein
MPNWVNPTDKTLVQLYEDDGVARVFFAEDDNRTWDISAPPTGELTLASLTKIMVALRYKPIGRWKRCDWGAERKFQPTA